MKSMCPPKRVVPLFLIIVLCSINFAAQSKSKKAPVKKNTAQTKDASKDSRSKSKREPLAKKNVKSDARKDRASAKKNASKNPQKEKVTAHQRAKENARTKSSPKNRAEARRLQAERRKEAQARRLAALAEKRRREQAAREARARKLAFERGLRTETVENISKDDTEGEDLAIRRAAVNALGNHAGTVVVMESQTGKVVTIVNQDWAIRDSFKPCSTIKLVTGVAGLNEKVIDDDGGIRSMRMDLQDALAFSNNGYFQRVGSAMGNNKMIDYARTLGLGERTGINADGETPGRLPYGNSNPRIYSHGDDFEVTPLQLAVMVSALTNGGKKLVPQISRARVERTAFRPLLKSQVDIPQQSIEGVLPGMIGAAEYGTARRGVDASMGVAGKTGSCISKGSWVGLFASVAPVEDPKYSVVVITRGQNERGRHAAAVAGKVYQALRSRVTRNPNHDLARRLQLAKPVTPHNSTMASEEEDDIEMDESTAQNEGEEASIVAGSRPNQAPAARTSQVPAVPPAEKKLVQRTTSSKPTNFPPVVITYDKEAAEKQTRPRIVKID